MKIGSFLLFCFCCVFFFVKDSDQRKILRSIQQVLFVRICLDNLLCDVNKLLDELTLNAAPFGTCRLICLI